MTTSTFNFEFNLFSCNVESRTLVPITGTIPTGFTVNVFAFPSFENVYHVVITSPDLEVTSMTGTFSYKKKGDCKRKNKTFNFAITTDPFSIDAKSMVFPDAKCGSKVKVNIRAVLA